MEDQEVAKKLTWLVYLQLANLLALIALVLAMALGLLPKVERAVQQVEKAVATTERVEARFQSFADEVQPVLTVGAGKAMETIEKMDAERLSETATEQADSLIDSAAERAKRFLERDKNDGS